MNVRVSFKLPGDTDSREREGLELVTCIRVLQNNHYYPLRFLRHFGAAAFMSLFSKLSDSFISLDVGCFSKVFKEIKNHGRHPCLYKYINWVKISDKNQVI